MHIVTGIPGENSGRALRNYLELISYNMQQPTV